jgi:hypothetical protein
MEMKITLSMPKTISRKVRVSKEIQASEVKNTEKSMVVIKKE